MDENKPLVMGIDPGKSGSIALINKDLIISTFPMKNMTEKDICDLINEYSDRTSYAAIERVWALPGQGAAAMWGFAGNFFTLKTSLYAFEYSFHEVLPRKWQTALGCLTKGDKNISKAKAQQLFPDVKVTHAIADSILIAYYALKYLG